MWRMTAGTRRLIACRHGKVNFGRFRTEDVQLDWYGSTKLACFQIEQIHCEEEEDDERTKSDKETNLPSICK